MLSHSRALLLLLFAGALIFQTEAQKDGDTDPLELSPGLLNIFKLGSTRSDTDSFFDADEKITCTFNESDTEHFTLGRHPAPSLGNLTTSDLKEMDKTLKVMILGTLKLVNQTVLTSWKEIVSLFEDSPFTQQRPELTEHRESEMEIRGEKIFTSGKRRKGSIVTKIEKWYQEFIRDEDVLKTSRIDIEGCGKVVAATGVKIKSVGTFFHRRIRRKEAKVMEVGVIRFPERNAPYFKVYRIQLFAWKSGKRILFHHEFKNGIQGYFTQLAYEPRELVLERLSEAVLDKGAKDAEELLLQ